MTESGTRARPLLVALATLLSIVALGEFYALYLQYQNNSYLQRYVSENFSGLVEQVAGLIIFGLGIAYLSYLLSRADPTSKGGRRCSPEH